MKRIFYFLLLSGSLNLLFSQFFITGSQPANGAVQVALTASINFSFTDAIDTTKHSGDEGYPLDMLSMEPADSLHIAGVSYSADFKTIMFQVDHRPATDYAWIILGGWSKSGQKLSQPFVLNYSTAATKGERTVSGIISSEKGDIMNTVVAMLNHSVFSNSASTIPHGATVIATAVGAYVCRDLRAGVYWPTAVKDSNGDGQFNPDSGDELGFYDPNQDGQPDSLKIMALDLSAIDMQLQLFMQPSMQAGTAKMKIDSVIAKAKSFAADQQLKAIFIHGDQIVEPNGEAAAWAYMFHSPFLKRGFLVFKLGEMIVVDTLQSHFPPMPVPLEQLITIPSNFIDSDSAVTIAERKDGFDFRMRFPGCKIMIAGGNLSWYFSQNPSKLFWVITYKANKPDGGNAEYIILVDMVSGLILSEWTTGVPQNTAERPKQFSLLQNYPNPFNPATVISFNLNRPSYIVLKIFDLLGREIKTLAVQRLDTGLHHFRFDAIDQSGNRLSAGVFFYRLQVDDYTEIRKMVLIQ